MLLSQTLNSLGARGWDWCVTDRFSSDTTSGPLVVASLQKKNKTELDFKGNACKTQIDTNYSQRNKNETKNTNEIQN